MLAAINKIGTVVLIFCLCGQVFCVSAQICKPDIFSVQYEGKAAYHAFQTIRTAKNEVVSIGNVLQVNGGFDYDAWAYKLSSRGTILWAKRYMPPGYNSGYFNSIVPLPNGSFLLSGRFSSLKRRFPDNQIEVEYSLTVICQLDAFGNLTWMSRLNPYRTYITSVNSLTQLQDGDILGQVSVFSFNFQQQLLFRMDNEGNVKWCRTLKAEDHQLSTPVFKQLRNGNILAGGWAFLPGDAATRRQCYYLFSLDPASGRITWSRGYSIGNTPRAYSISSVKSLTERSDGGINLFSSFSDSTGFVLFPGVQSGLRLQFSAGGDLQKAVDYQNGQPGCAFIDVQKIDNDSHLLLLNAVDMPVLAKMNKDGNIEWQKGYGKINGNIKANSVFPGKENHQLYFSGKSQVAMSALLQTEENGSLPCLETPSRLSVRDVTPLFALQNLPFSTEPFDSAIFSRTLLGLNRWPYELTPGVSCVTACCTDVTSDTTRIALCNQPSWQLPDGNIAKESGFYYTQHKTAQGCDSVAYYNVELAQPPQVHLGDDVCLEGRDSVVLKATAGYDRYNWMGVTGTDSTFTTRTPGIYWVSVANHCGAIRDTIQVFRLCDFAVFMPNAFTPNSDGRNDVFRYPPSAKNRFVRLTVYNRWGQKVFETNEAAKGWNGLLNGHPQPADTYIYLLETKTIDGRKRQQNGTVTLIR